MNDLLTFEREIVGILHVSEKYGFSPDVTPFTNQHINIIPRLQLHLHVKSLRH